MPESLLRIGRTAAFAGGLAVFMLEVAGCPAPATTGDSNEPNTTQSQGDPNSTTQTGNGQTSDPNSTTQTQANSIFTSSFSIQVDGMVAAGDGIVAFGGTPGGLTGVSVLHTGQTTATPIGNFRGDAVYCAGKKVIVVANNDPKRINVFDSTNNTTVEVPDSDVFDIVPGGNMENEYIAVDGNLVAYLNRGGPSGVELVVADVSGATPVVKTFTETLTNPNHLDVDGAAGTIAVMEDNQFITLFAASAAADSAPTRIDVKAVAGVPLAYYPKLRVSNGHVLFNAFSTNDVYLCNISSQAITKLTLNPSASDGSTQLALRGDVFAYALYRGPSDVDGNTYQGDRFAIGHVSAPGNVVAASGANLNGGLAGFGYSAAILPNGSVFIAGRLGESLGAGLIEPTALQADQGQGLALLRDGSGTPIQAADVSASTNVVAFKVYKNDLDVRIGYYVP